MNSVLVIIRLLGKLSGRISTPLAPQHLLSVTRANVTIANSDTRGEGAEGKFYEKIDVSFPSFSSSATCGINCIVVA